VGGSSFFADCLIPRYLSHIQDIFIEEAVWESEEEESQDAQVNRLP
jgi:hypothetical protein